MNKKSLFILMVSMTAFAGGDGVLPLLRGGSGGFYLEGHFEGTVYDNLSPEGNECQVAFDSKFVNPTPATWGYEVSSRKYVCGERTYESPAFVAVEEPSRWSFWSALRVGETLRGVSTSHQFAVEGLAENHGYFAVEVSAEYTSLSEGLELSDGQHAFYGILKASAK